MEDSEIVAMMKRERVQMSMREKIDGAIYLWFWASTMGRILNADKHIQAKRIVRIAETI
jgi:hypothetical protein